MKEPYLTCWSDQRRSATAAALGHVADMELVASTNSPHMHASPPITRSCCLLLPCTHSFMRSFTAVVHSIIYSVTHSITQWVIQSVMIHAFIHSLIQPIDHSICVFSQGHARIALSSSLYELQVSQSAGQQLIALVCYKSD